MEPLKLVALDLEDLQVLSAHLQDAVMRIGDMAYVPSEKRFAVMVNRFDWEGAEGKKKRANSFERRRSALRFDRVLATQVLGIKQGAKDAVVELLAIQFEETKEPEGHIKLIFAGGGAIRLHVECIEAEMVDMGPVWRTKTKPEHAASADEQAKS